MATFYVRTSNKHSEGGYIAILDTSKLNVRNYKSSLRYGDGSMCVRGATCII